MAFVSMASYGAEFARWTSMVVFGLALAIASATADTTVETDVDRAGGDLKSLDLPQPDLALCRQACEQDEACKAYTYVKPGVQGPGARCWLKSSAGRPSPNACCISGIKTAGRSEQSSTVEQPADDSVGTDGFRPRSVAARQATLRRLGIMNAAQSYLNNPFSLTARRPYVAGRGRLELNGNLLYATMNDRVTFKSGNADGWARIYLENASGKRHLIDCTIGGKVVMQTASVVAQLPAKNPKLTLLSIVTAPGEDVVTLKDPDLPSNQWQFGGCEITRIQ